MWPQPGLPHPDGGSCTLSSHSLPTSLKHISVIITHSSKPSMAPYYHRLESRQASH